MAGSDIVAAAGSGDRRGTLIALRDEIARQIAECESGRDMAALSKRLMEVMDEIERMPDPSRRRRSKLRQAQGE